MRRFAFVLLDVVDGPRYPPVAHAVSVETECRRADTDRMTSILGTKIGYVAKMHNPSIHECIDYTSATDRGNARIE